MISGKDPDGLELDFLRADHRRAVRLRIKEEEPYLVVGLTSLYRIHGSVPEFACAQSGPSSCEATAHRGRDLTQVCVRNRLGSTVCGKTCVSHRSMCISACMAVPSNRRDSLVRLRRRWSTSAADVHVTAAAEYPARLSKAD